MKKFLVLTCILLVLAGTACGKKDEAKNSNATSNKEVLEEIVKDENVTSDGKDITTIKEEIEKKAAESDKEKTPSEMEAEAEKEQKAEETKDELREIFKKKKQK